MTQTETLKLALEASKDLCPEFALAKVQEILTKALAQPEQAPVAWGNFKEDGTLVGLSQHPEDQANWTGRKPLYTTPPQRKPLTDMAEVLVEAMSLIHHYGGHGWSKAAHDEGERITKNARKALAAHGIKGEA